MAGPRLKGLAATMRKLYRLTQNYPNASVVAMYQEAGVIFDMSQQEVPVDQGDLMQSGGVFMFRTGDGWKVIISYSAAYALRIHEITEYDTSRALPGSEEYLSGETEKTTGKSKYLEHPFQQQMAGIEGRIAKRVQLLIATSGAVPDPSQLPQIKGTKGR